MILSVLDELLYEWIFEIRTEFSQPLESEVVKFVGSPRKPR